MASTESIIIELQYLPPIQFFSKLVTYPVVHIEYAENYRKGSYRNRCHIAGSNGLLRLSIPLKKGKNEKQPIQSVQIAHDSPWRSQHWQSIRSAYGNAPFFEYYAETIQPFYKKKYDFLYEFNWDLLQCLIQLIGINTTLSKTSHYEENPLPPIQDLRNAIHPKAKYHRPDPNFKIQHYGQVFQEKSGFLPNLSILDLLFCTGPQAVLILEESFINS